MWSGYAWRNVGNPLTLLKCTDNSNNKAGASHTSTVSFTDQASQTVQGMHLRQLPHVGVAVC